MTSKEARLKKKAKLKQKILQISIKIASEEGWEAVTMRRISAEIKYSLPIIYLHFSSKENLIYEASEEGYKKLIESLQATLEKEKDPRKILNKTCWDYCQFGLKNKALYQSMYGLEGIAEFMGNPSPEGRKLFELVKNKFTEMNQIGVIQLNTSPNLATKLLWSGLHGMVSLTFINRIEDGEVTLKQLAENFSQSLAELWVKK